MNTENTTVTTEQNIETDNKSVGARKLKIQQAETKWLKKLNALQFYIVRGLQTKVQTFAPNLGLYFLPNFIAWKNNDTQKSDYFCFIKASRKKVFLYIKADKEIRDSNPSLEYVSCYNAVKFVFSLDELETEQELAFVTPILQKSFFARLNDKKVSRSRLYE